MGWKMHRSYDKAWENAVKNEADREAEIRRPARKADWWWQEGEWSKWLDLERSTANDIRNANQARSVVIKEAIRKAIQDAAITIPSIQQPVSDGAIEAVASNMNNDVLAYMFAHKIQGWAAEGKPVEAAKRLILNDLQSTISEGKALLSVAQERGESKVTINTVDGQQAEIQVEVYSKYIMSLEKAILIGEKWPESRESGNYPRVSEERDPARFWVYDESYSFRGSRSPNNATEFSLYMTALKIKEDREQILGQRFGASSADIKAALDAIKQNTAITPFVRSLIALDLEKIKRYITIAVPIEQAAQAVSRDIFNLAVRKYGAEPTAQSFQSAIEQATDRNMPLIDRFNITMKSNRRFMLPADAEQLKKLFDTDEKAGIYLDMFDDKEWSNDATNLLGEEAILSSLLEADEAALADVLADAQEEYAKATAAYMRSKKKLALIRGMGRFALTADWDALLQDS